MAVSVPPTCSAYMLMVKSVLSFEVSAETGSASVSFPEPAAKTAVMANLSIILGYNRDQKPGTYDGSCMESIHDPSFIANPSTIYVTNYYSTFFRKVSDA